MGASVHLESIMYALNFSLPAKVKLQVMFHVKKRQSQPVSQTSTEEVRSTKMLQPFLKPIQKQSNKTLTF
ncbi:hypothetical protein HMI55_005872 [Coelomomyces lativittatus]|nr:hypothetical protein HMI55_005872 [Coelomomyces lativittatus]